MKRKKNFKHGNKGGGEDSSQVAPSPKNNGNFGGPTRDAAPTGTSTAFGRQTAMTLDVMIDREAFETRGGADKAIQKFVQARKNDQRLREA